MMRSMYSGVSGLRVHQTKMDVIGNNISNINTVGFKRSSTSFKDSFNQTLSSASAANQDKGGMNPQQVGLGASVGSIVNVMTQGAAQRTDYASDIFIEGEGFFIVKNATGTFFTRAGVFEVDAAGNFVDPNGNNLCGWKAVPDPDKPGQQKIVKDAVVPINIYEGQNLYAPPEMTTNIEFTGNFNQTTDPTQKNTISFYDSLGNRYTINVKFDKNNEGGEGRSRWNFSIPTLPEDAPNGTAGMLEVTVNGTEKMYVQGFTPPDGAFIEFDTSGKIIGNSIIDIQGLETLPGSLQKLQRGEDGALALQQSPINSTVSNSIKLDFSQVTQFNSKANVTSQEKDGNAAGTLSGYNVDGNGIIRGTYTNGKTKILAQIPLADFVNPAGLEKFGSNLFMETPNSGRFDGIGIEASAIGSKLQGGALEMSNVDLSYEFSEMITTQRGFQANSRIITTSDEMIQELVNLKR